MNLKSYSAQLLIERTEHRQESRAWLECHLAQTPPTYERCKAWLEEKGLSLTRRDYESVCKKLVMEPQYENSPGKD